MHRSGVPPPRLGRRAVPVLLALATLAGWADGTARDRPNGILLVARAELPDANFRDSVVLATRHQGGGVVGVILNRPTAVPLGQVFPDSRALGGRPDVLFRGGPVSPATVVVVFRSADHPPRSLHVLDDVYMSLDVQLIDRLVGRRDLPELRVYAGYSGWAPGQLEAEIHRGDWYVLDADAETIFRLEPHTMWRTLLRRASSRTVRAGSCGPVDAGDPEEPTNPAPLAVAGWRP